MRTNPLRIGALAVLLVSLVAGAASAVAAHYVPFRGSAAGTVVAVVPDSGGWLDLTIEASGHATQLGHFDRVEQLRLHPGTGAFTGSIWFEAANGDELFVTTVGQFVSATTAQGTYAIDHGTGRFAGATGSATFEAVSPDFVNMTVRFDGTISTVGG